MKQKAFFTREMGARLRTLRVRSGLTQKELAARMGLRPRGGRAQVSLVEAGLNPNPTLRLVTTYLRACGAGFAEFYDLLTRVDIKPVDTREIGRTGFPQERKEKLRQDTVRQVQKYRMRIEHPGRGAPMLPARQESAVRRFGRHRVRVNIVEEAVKQMLGLTEVKAAFYPGYLTLARQFLKVFRGSSGPEQTERLAALTADAGRKGLDRKVALQVRTVVAAQIRSQARARLSRQGSPDRAG
jgi:transcriptional regulator with XRE-family HTH domain